ncbi:hypothetical protein F0U60_48360 [Archangium minus]|uniref:Uncharacterized protein n=1 Tax=Archangium minus TaxID=83450 RepID=A0ABY9X6Q0_9BACT|nr:hypothetical protein F0U60_48360 [Archangium minus]
MPVESAELEKGWSLTREGDVLRLRWRWYLPDIWWSLLLLAGMAFPIVQVLNGAHVRKGSPESFVAGFAGICFVLAYAILVSLINRTTLEASPRTGIRVRNGPLPSLLLPRTVAMQDIRQLYGRQTGSRTRKGRRFPVYALYVLGRDGSRRRLAGYLLTERQLLFLERALEEHLGLEDWPVSEEP